jgi:hypothetical protein
MVEPIYKDLVIETEAKMEIWLRWLLFCAQCNRAKSFKSYDLARTQTGHPNPSRLRQFCLESFILKD